MTPLTPELRRQISARLNFYRELGIYGLYWRPAAETAVGRWPLAVGQNRDNDRLDMRNERMSAAAAEQTTDDQPLVRPMAKGQPGPPARAGFARAGVERPTASSKPTTLSVLREPADELETIRKDIGDCTRCRLHKGRTNIVFGTGNANAELMFIGEGPGADEDAQGLPFVGRAGQLLNNMIAAMGLKREDVYIANVVKCRPPGNRTPEKDECDTCMPFLMRQISAIRPKAIVALGATAAKNLLGIGDTMAAMRSRSYEFSPPAYAGDAIRLFVTYHPAYLLRDPRQKKETWKDLQQVMRFLGLAAPTKPAKTED